MFPQSKNNMRTNPAISKGVLYLTLLVNVAASRTATTAGEPGLRGPLRVHPQNSRYFTDGSGKAIIATARKFLRIIYQTLKNGWIFEDFPKFVIANT
jgi:hypothetical protein